MARCSNCNRFVSYGDGTVEVSAETPTMEGILTVSIRVVLSCDECSGELKEYSEDVDIDLVKDFDLSLQPEYCLGRRFALAGKEYLAIAGRSFDMSGNEIPLEWLYQLFAIAQVRKCHDWRDGQDRFGRPREIEPPEYVELVTPCGSAEVLPSLDACIEKLAYFARERFTQERWEVETDEEFSERSEGSGRYAKTFYGADVTVKVKDLVTGKEHEFKVSVEEAASAFDEC